MDDPNVSVTQIPLRQQLNNINSNNRSLQLQEIEEEEVDQEYLCRICLEPCLNIQFCNCILRLLCHQKCLIEYLSRSKQLDSAVCEICKRPYVLEVDFSVRASCQKFKKTLSHYPWKCAVSSLYSASALIFYVMFGLESKAGRVGEVAFMVFLIVAIVLGIVSVFLLVMWLYDFMLVEEWEIRRVADIGEQGTVTQRRRKRRDINPATANRNLIANSYQSTLNHN